MILPDNPGSSFFNQISINGEVSDLSLSPPKGLVRIRPEHIQGNFSDEINQIFQIRQVGYGIIAPIIVSCGILGNLLTILIMRLPQFKDVTYAYFKILALCDLMSLLFTISILVHILNPATAVYSTVQWYSHAELFLSNVPMTTSVLIVMCITIDRFFSICRPIQFKLIHTKKYSTYGIIGAFILSSIIWLPVCFIKTPQLISNCKDYDDIEINSSNLYVACKVLASYSTFYQAYSWIRQTIIAFIPIIVMIILNILIIRQFRIIAKTRKNMHRQLPTIIKKNNSEDTNIVYLLIAIMISFFITMLPPGIFNAIYTMLKIHDANAEIFRAIANNLELLNHSLNFYLYIILSKPMRRLISSFIRKQIFNSPEIHEHTTNHAINGYMATDSNNQQQNQPTMRRPGNVCNVTNGVASVTTDRSKTLSTLTEAEHISLSGDSDIDQFQMTVDSKQIEINDKSNENYNNGFNHIE